MNREGKKRDAHEDVDVNALSRTKALLYHHLESNANSGLIGKIYLDLGEIYQRIRNYPLAHEAWNKASGYFADVKESLHLAITYYQQGMLFLHERQGEKAFEKWGQVLQVLADESRESLLLRSQTVYQMGTYLLEEGKVEEAKSYLEEGIGTARRGGHLREEVLAMRGMARLHSQAKRICLATKIYHNILDKCRGLQDEAILGSVINDLGYLYEAKKEYRRALSAFHYSREIERRLGNPNLHNTLVELARLYLRFDLEQAKVYCQEAIDLLLAGLSYRFNERQEKQLAQVFELMAFYCREKSDRKNMLIFCRQALEIYKKYRMEKQWNEMYQIYSKFAPTGEIEQYNEAWELINGLPQHEKLRLHKFIG